MPLSKDLNDFIDRTNKSVGSNILDPQVLEGQITDLGVDPQAVTTDDIQKLAPIISQRIREREQIVQQLNMSGKIDQIPPLRALTDDELKGTSLSRVAPQPVQPQKNTQQVAQQPQQGSTGGVITIPQGQTPQQAMQQQLGTGLLAQLDKRPNSAVSGLLPIDQGAEVPVGSLPAPSDPDSRTSRLLVQQGGNVQAVQPDPNPSAATGGTAETILNSIRPNQQAQTSQSQQSAVSQILPTASADQDQAQQKKEPEQVSVDSIKAKVTDVLSRANIEGKEDDPVLFYNAVKAVLRDQLESAKTETGKLLVSQQVDSFIDEINSRDNLIRSANQFFAANNNNEPETGTIATFAGATANSFVASFTEAAAGIAGIAGFDDFAESARELADKQRQFFDTDDDSLAADIGNITGSILSFLVPGGALKLAGKAGRFGKASNIAASTPAAATLSFGQITGYQASDLRRDYEATVLARGEEVNEELANNLELFAAPLLALPELVAPVLILRRFGGVAVDSIFKTAALEGAAEGVGATITDLSKNLIAANVVGYDPEREVFTPGALIDVAKTGGIEAAAGSIVSSAVSLISNALNKRGIKLNPNEVNQNDSQTNRSNQEGETSQQGLEQDQGSQQAQGREPSQVQSQTETTQQVSPIDPNDFVRPLRQPPAAATPRQQQLDQVVLPIVDDLVRTNAESIAAINQYDDLPIEFKLNIGRAKSPEQQLLLISTGIDLAEKKISARERQAEFLESRTSKTLADLTTAQQVYIQTKDKTLIQKLYDSLSDRSKIINKLNVNNSLDLNKAINNQQVIFSIDPTLVNGVEEKGRLKINKITPDSIQSATFTSDEAFVLARQDGSFSESFDTNNFIRNADGTITVNRNKAPVDGNPFKPEHIPLLEDARRAIKLEPVNTNIVDRLGLLQRVRYGLPANNPTLVDKVAYPVIRTLREKGTVPFQLSRLLDQGRDGGRALASRIHALNDLAFKEITGQKSIFKSTAIDPNTGTSRNARKVINDNEIDIFSTRNTSNDITQYDTKLNLFNLAIRGDKDAFNQLSPRLKRITGEIRAEVRHAGELLVDSNELDEKLKSKIDDNLESYLLRSYKVFRPEENWNYQTVVRDHRDIFDEALNYITGVYLKQDGAKKSNAVSATERANETIRDMLNASRANGILYGTVQSGRTDIRSFISKKDIHPSIRKLLGEDVNPFKVIKGTADRLPNIHASIDAQRGAREYGLQAGFFSTKPDHEGNMAERLFAKKNEHGVITTNPNFSGFGEVYTSPELASAMEQAYNSFGGLPNRVGEVIGKTVRTATAASKINLVLLSPQAYSTNLIGAGAVELYNGRMLFNNKGVISSLKAFNPRLGRANLDKLYTVEKRERIYNAKASSFINDKGSIVTTKDSNPFSQDAIVGELRRGGLIDVSVVGSDVEQNIKKSLTIPLVGTALSKVTTGLGKAYQIPDNAGKYNAYAVELDKNIRAFPDLDMKSVIDKTLNDVRETTMNYNLVPTSVKFLSNHGLGVSTFVSFSSELLRTSVNTARLATREIRSGNPELAKAGARRIAGLLATGTLMAATGEFVREKFTSASEEAERILSTWFQPEWNDGRKITTSGFDGETYSWFDAGYIFPHMMFFNVVNNVIEHPEDTAIQSFGRALVSFNENFVGDNIAQQMITQVLTNTNGKGGKIYDDRLTEEDQNKWTNITAHVFNSMYIPGVQRLYNNAIKAKEDEIGYMGSFRTKDDLIKSLLGFRQFSNNVPKAIEQVATNFIREMNESKRIANSEKPDFMDQGEHDEIVAAETRKIREVQQGFGQFVRDMVILSKQPNLKYVDQIPKDLRKLANDAPEELQRVLKIQGVIPMTNEEVREFKRVVNSREIRNLTPDQMREVFTYMPPSVIQSIQPLIQTMREQRLNEELYELKIKNFLIDNGVPENLIPDAIDLLK